MKKKLVDLFDRAGATFAQAFLAAVTLGTLTDVNALKLAGIAGAYAVAKYLLVEANKYLDKPEGEPVVVIGNPPEQLPAPPPPAEPTPETPPSA